MPATHALKNNRLTQINKAPFGAIVRAGTPGQIAGRNRLGY